MEKPPRAAAVQRAPDLGTYTRSGATAQPPPLDLTIAVSARAWFWLVVAVAAAVGIAARAQHLGSWSFPLGEGGLFATFSEAISHNHFRLPYYVQYGGAAIPFAYPPAAFYICALIAHFSGASLLSVYYVFPITLNLLALPAFAWVAAAHARDRVEFACATLLYAAVPESFVWQITGGGAPRALAALFTLIAVGWALRAAAAGPRLRDALGIGALVGLAILSHLEWGMTAAIAVTLAIVTRAGLRSGLKPLALVALTAAVVIAPWLATVLHRHGPAPFLSSSSASQWDLRFFLTRALTGQFLVGVLTWPALVGAAAGLRRRDVFALAWAVLLLWTTPRMALASGLAIPAALLAGRGLSSLGRIGSGRPWLSYAAAAVLCLALVAPPLPRLFIDFAVMRQLRPEWRASMAWIAGNTPPSAKFAVLSDAPIWWEDSTAEWFPALAARTSLTTAQGLEWVAPGAFSRRLDEIATLKAVQRAPPQILFRFVQEDLCEADYVAIFSRDLAHATAQPPAGFTVVHRGLDSAVLRRLARPSSCGAAR